MATLLGAEGYKLLEKYKIPVAPYAKVRSKDELAKFIEAHKFPIVMKAISQSIVHKTEAGAVKIVSKSREASEAFESLQKIGYVLAQKFVEGQQVIIGAKQDATFGKVILFGGGGIFVELLKDVSFRVCPINSKDAEAMIAEVKFAKVLKGFRGSVPVNVKALQDILLKVCQLSEKEDVEELDLNPIIVNAKEARVADIRIIT